MLTPDLVEVEADPPHHRVLAGPPDVRPSVEPALVTVEAGSRDDSAGLALLAQPAPPLGVVLGHILRGHPGVVERVRLAVLVRRSGLGPAGVRVLVLHRAERMAQLVQRDERTLRAPTGGRRVETADPAIGERVEDRQRLQVVGVRGDTELRGDVVLQVHRPLLITGGCAFRQRCAGTARALVAADGVVVDRAPGQRVHASVRIDQAQRGELVRVCPAFLVRVTPHARLAGDDLQQVHVDVVAVRPERFDTPLNRLVPVDVLSARVHLIVLVTVAHDDQVETLVGRPRLLKRDQPSRSCLWPFGRFLLCLTGCWNGHHQPCGDDRRGQGSDYSSHPGSPHRAGASAAVHWSHGTPPP